MLIDSGLETLDYVAIGAYLVVTFGISVWFGRRQKSVDDFFVGGRQMPWFAVGLSIMATLFSTLSYVGGPGEMIKNGIGMAMGILSIPCSMLVIFFLWIPFFMRLKVTSAYEYLERRFSYSVRLMGATLFILLRLGWMSMVVFAASMALDRVKGADIEFLSGPDIYWWIAFVGAFAAVYTSIRPSAGFRR
jgi:SSS family solute:Na+ symporter